MSCMSWSYTWSLYISCHPVPADVAHYLIDQTLLHRAASLLFPFLSFCEQGDFFSSDFDLESCAFDLNHSLQQFKMRSSILVLLTAAATAMAVPTGWSAPAAKYYARVSQEIRNLQNQDTLPAPSCDLSTMVLPHTSEPLPGVPKGQKLLAVGIGRGTQVSHCSSLHPHIASFDPPY